MKLATIVSAILLFVFIGLGIFAILMNFPTLGLILFSGAGLAFVVAVVSGIIILVERQNKNEQGYQNFPPQY